MDGRRDGGGRRKKGGWMTGGRGGRGRAQRQDKVCGSPNSAVQVPSSQTLQVLDVVRLGGAAAACPARPQKPRRGTGREGEREKRRVFLIVGRSGGGGR